jgi:hypothetical protein
MRVSAGLAVLITLNGCLMLLLIVLVGDPDRRHSRQLRARPSQMNDDFLNGC